MKIWKKNMVAAAVLVTVCAGIYVNWLYTEDIASSGLEDTLDAEKVMSDDTLLLSGDMAAIAAGEEVQTTASDYFAAVRLSRQEARDELKTNRVKPETVLSRAQHYAPQVEAYANALARIFERPVKEKLLYFFKLGKAVALD